MRSIYYIVLRFIMGLFPIQHRKIFFMSYYGSQYGCNPKYLSKYVVENYPEWTVVWGFTEPNKYNVPHVRKVRYLSLAYFYEIYTSQVFVTNFRMTEHYRKRRGQLYIQTWHGSVALKKIEKDTEKTLPAHYVMMAKRDSLQTDVLLSGCQFCTDIYNRAFWYSGAIVSSGTPREDIMFSSNIKKRNSIKAKLDVSIDKKIVLYGPTFRKDYSLDCYNVDYNRLLTSLSDKFGGEWIVLLRLHPHLRDFSMQLVVNNPMLVDVTSYDDIQELLFISDFVISDYSSLIFDFALTYRPCFLYTSDLDTYTQNDRALYFEIENLPFPICRNNDELNTQIQAFDEIKYKQEISSFLHMIGSFETGHACENVVNYIRTIIGDVK